MIANQFLYLSNYQHGYNARNYSELLTRHAQERLQQRCIPLFVVDLVIEFGKLEYDKHGGEKYYFDKRSKRRLHSYLGKALFRAINDYLNVYIVMVEGKVITCGYRTKAINKH